MALQETIADITANFKLQGQLYMDMAVLSGEQLALVGKKPYTDNNEKLNQVLTQRQELMKKISGLNDKNKELRQKATTKLGIDNFILSKLAGSLEEPQYLELQSVVSQIEEILTRIEGMDRQSETLMRQAAQNRNKIAPANHNQATQAYEKAKNLENK